MAEPGAIYRPALPTSSAGARTDRNRRGIRLDRIDSKRIDQLFDLKLSGAAARRSRFKPESIHLTLVGLCPECQSKG